MMGITMMVWSLIYSQTSWSAKSSVPQEALQRTIYSQVDGIPTELLQILKDDAVKVLHPICQQIWKTQWLQHWKRSVFTPIPNKGNAKEWANYCTVVLISHASKIMLKIPQARLQQYVSQEVPDVQAVFRKGRGNRRPNCQHFWIIQKEREF